MRKKKPALLNAKVGDITAVSLGDGVYCYLRSYGFGCGVLPFLSRGVQFDAKTFPSLIPAFFIHTWVYTNDPTPMNHIVNVMFATEEESWGPPAYYPPDEIEPCYKIHGIFNGSFSILKPVSESDVMGLEEFKRYQPAELRSLLFFRRVKWDYILESESNLGESTNKESNQSLADASKIILIEIVFKSSDFTFAGRDEVEDPLAEALEQAELGEVTGGGGGGDSLHIDVEIFDLKPGLKLIRKVLRRLSVAPSTAINQLEPELIVHSVYDKS